MTQDSQRWSLVVLTGWSDSGFSDKKMSGLLFSPQKSGRNNGVVVWRGSTVQSIFFKAGTVGTLISVLVSLSP